MAELNEQVRKCFDEEVASVTPEVASSRLCRYICCIAFTQLSGFTCCCTSLVAHGRNFKVQLGRWSFAGSIHTSSTIQQCNVGVVYAYSAPLVVCLDHLPTVATAAVLIHV